MKLSRIDGNHHLSPYGAGSYDRMQDNGMPEGGITSSFRDPEEQKRLFLSRYRKQLTGRGPFNDVRWWRAVRYVRHSPLGPVAVPGTSLHEKGLALDMSTSSAAHKWMLKNARKH